MAVPSTLNASHESQLRGSWRCPYTQASRLFVTNGTTFAAVDDVLRCAIFGLMANLITFEAHLLSALIRIMCVLAAKNASWLLCFIRTLLGDVAKLAAVVTFQCNIVLCPITTLMILLHLLQETFLELTIFIRCLRLRTIRANFIRVFVLVHLEVLIAFQE